MRDRVDGAEEPLRADAQASFGLRFLPRPDDAERCRRTEGQHDDHGNRQRKRNTIFAVGAVGRGLVDVGLDHRDHVAVANDRHVRFRVLRGPVGALRRPDEGGVQLPLEGRSGSHRVVGLERLAVICGGVACEDQVAVLVEGFDKEDPARRWYAGHQGAPRIGRKGRLQLRADVGQPLGERGGPLAGFAFRTRAHQRIDGALDGDIASAERDEGGGCKQQCDDPAVPQMAPQP